jgi:predicted nucleic-acid-binding protein
MEKRNSASFDTNLLLRLVLNYVPEQATSVKRILSGGGKYAVADVALTEMVFVLERLYKMERQMITQFLLVILRHPQFVCNRSLFEKVLPLYLSEPALSIVDCTLLEYARLNKTTPLYSFDKKLVKMSNGDAKIPA